MFSKYDKAFAGPIGLWLAQGISLLFERGLGIDTPESVEIWLATALSGLLVLVVPNKS